MFRTTLELALQAIRRNLMRSILTTLGIVIGVAAVITMVTVGNGATAQVTRQISSLGSNLLMVNPGRRMGPGQSVGEIPLLDAMEAEVFVLEVDGSGLAEKQAAEVVIEARPDRGYPGTIRLVDKLAQPRQPGSPVQYFAVVIQLATTCLVRS